MKQIATQKNKHHSRSPHNPLPPGKDFLSTREAAKILCLSVGTVQKMVDSGILEAWTTAGGHRRIRAESAHAFLTTNKPNKTAPASGKRLSVLIAEDDPMQCRIYETSINGWDLPIELKIVPDGFAALIEAGRNIPDVMVIDLMMPGMNGFDLIPRIRSDQSFSNTDIMVVTALHPQEIEAEGGLPAGVLVIEKPIPFEVLYGFMSARLVAKLRNQSVGRVSGFIA